MDNETLISNLIANSKKGSQIPEALELNPEDYLFVYVSGVGFKKVKKSNIVFPGEPITTLIGLSDTPNQTLGQAGKILVVKADETGFEYKVLAEVTGVDQATFDLLEARVLNLENSSLDPTVDHTYNTISLMIAGQNDQLEDDIIKVLDASEDGVTGRAYYFYNGTIAGTIEDYTSLTGAEVQALTAQAITDALGGAPALDADVVKSVLDSEGNELKDEFGVVQLPEIVSDNASRIPYSFTATEGQQVFTVPSAFFQLDVQVGNTPLAPTQYTTYLEDGTLTEGQFRIEDTVDTGAKIFVWAWVSFNNVPVQDKTDVFSFAATGTGDIASGDCDPVLAPYDFTLNNYFVQLTGAPTGSAAVFDLKKNGVSVTSSDAIIEATETNSLTGTAPVITTTSFLKGDLITPNIIQVGNVEPGKSAKYYLEITKL